MGIIESTQVSEGFLEINMKKAQKFKDILSNFSPLYCFLLDNEGKLEYFDHSCILYSDCTHIPGAPKGVILVQITKMRLLPDHSPIVTETIRKLAVFHQSNDQTGIEQKKLTELRTIIIYLTH
ncbi:MAG: hypothetical protein ACFFCQ_11860 [Promethearchaeota archaeon]